MERIRFFRDSLLGTECDACGGRVDLMQGGACPNCRRILCFRHLYGSWFARLRSELGRERRCVECRAGRTPAPAAPQSAPAPSDRHTARDAR